MSVQIEVFLMSVWIYDWNDDENIQLNPSRGFNS